MHNEITFHKKTSTTILLDFPKYKKCGKSLKRDSHKGIYLYEIFIRVSIASFFKVLSFH